MTINNNSFRTPFEFAKTLAKALPFFDFENTSQPADGSETGTYTLGLTDMAKAIFPGSPDDMYVEFSVSGGTADESTMWVAAYLVSPSNGRKLKRGKLSSWEQPVSWIGNLSEAWGAGWSKVTKVSGRSEDERERLKTLDSNHQATVKAAVGYANKHYGLSIGEGTFRAATYADNGRRRGAQVMIPIRNGVEMVLTPNADCPLIVNDPSSEYRFDVTFKCSGLGLQDIQKAYRVLTVDGTK